MTVATPIMSETAVADTNSATNARKYLAMTASPNPPRPTADWQDMDGGGAARRGNEVRSGTALLDGERDGSAVRVFRGRASRVIGVFRGRVIRVIRAFRGRAIRVIRVFRGRAIRVIRVFRGR